jgi:hypothetical protein
MTRAGAALTALLCLLRAPSFASGEQTLAECRRRLELLPQIEKWRTSGDPKSSETFSVSGLLALDVEIKTMLAETQAEQRLLPKLSLKDIKGAIPTIPGPPGYDLPARKTYWQRQRVEFQGYADLIARMTDPENTNSRLDEFGDSVPQSIPRWRDRQQSSLDASKRETIDLAARIDGMSEPLNRDSQLGLPRLSGLALVKLLEVIKTFRLDVKAAKATNDGSDAAAQAAADLPRIAAAADALERGALRWAAAEELVPVVDADITALARVQAGFSDLARMADDVLADAKLDQDFLDGISVELYEQARARKIGVVEKMPSRLKNAKLLIEEGLIPYQKRRVQEASPRDGRLAHYYETQVSFLTSLP